MTIRLLQTKLAVENEWLSEYQTELLENKSVINITKLVPNLMDKKKYVVHYRNLHLYLSLGMKLKKVHRILEFNEKPWLEPYIRLNKELRKKAMSAFEKDFYKLMNNSVFGKTMENLRKQVDIKLVRTDGTENEKIRKIMAMPNYNRRVKFSDELSAIHVHKTKLILNKPTSVLDLSQHLIYNWYYNKLKKKYSENCTLLYTHTDSLLVDIKTKDTYKDMSEIKDDYDFSDYPKDHPLCDELFNKQMYTHKMNMLRSVHHNIYGLTVNKTTLSPLDTKRYITPDGIMTYTYGYQPKQ